MSGAKSGATSFEDPFYKLENDRIVQKGPIPSSSELEAINDATIELARYVESQLINVEGFIPLTIPLAMDEEDEATRVTTTILASENFYDAERFVMIVMNSSGSLMGIFSRSLCFDESLSTGTMLNCVRLAKSKGYGVVILRPNTNTHIIEGNTKVDIPGSENPVLHAFTAWEHIIPLCNNLKEVFLLSYGGGSSLCHEIYQRSLFTEGNIRGIVTIEASHLTEKDDPDDLKQHLKNIAMNFQVSSAPKGAHLEYRTARVGCECVSVGIPKMSKSNVPVNNALAVDVALGSAFDFFAALTASRGGSPALDFITTLQAQCKTPADAKKITENPDPFDTDDLEDSMAASTLKSDSTTAPPQTVLGRLANMFASSSTKAEQARQREEEANLNLTIDDFDLLKIVGRGAFGKVLLVRKKAGYNAGNVYAMKVLKKAEVVAKAQVEHTKAEQAILVKIEHPFIVCLRFSFQNTDKLYLITDYYSGGTLYTHLRQSKFFPEERAKFYAAELTLALQHLHDQGIIYRDLKLENILMDHLGHVCLTDFGLSKQDFTNKGATTFCGTPEYIAPELLKRQVYGPQVDWWSFGILL
jgi:hypothetical protein